MAIELLGYETSSASQNISITLNVPAATDYLIATLNSYPTANISNVELNSVAMNTIFEQRSTVWAALFDIVSPSTGSAVPFSASIDASLSEGAVWAFAYFSGVHQTTPIRDSDGYYASSGNTTNTLDCAADDYVFISCGGDATPYFTANVTTIGTLEALNQIIGIAGDLVASGSTITVGSTNANYSAQACCTIIPAGSAAVELEGSVSASSEVTGSLLISKELSGTVPAVGTQTGEILVEKNLSSTVPSVSTVTGSLSGLAELAGIVSTVSVASGSLEVQKELSGQVAAASEVTGSITNNQYLAGIITAVSVVTGSLQASKELSGTVITVSTVIGAIDNGIDFDDIPGNFVFTGRTTGNTFTGRTTNNTITARTPNIDMGA